MDPVDILLEPIWDCQHNQWCNRARICLQQQQQQDRCRAPTWLEAAQ
jgi:hypothetical protein